MNKLLYISRANEIYQDKQRFSVLARKCAQKNRESNISGALFYSDGYFLQLLEGDEAKIAETYLRIRSDESHKDIQLIPFENESSRIFMDWAMSSNWVESKNGVNKIDGRLSNFKQIIADNNLTSLYQVLEAFFAPLSNPAGLFFREKIVIVSDSHAKGASFMNWVATNEDSKSHQINFTPISNSETNNDNDEQLLHYIDISKPDQPQRIIGVETAVLGQPSLLPLLSNASKVVLFISNNTEITEQSIGSLSEKHRSLLQSALEVICIFSKNATPKKDIVRSSLSQIGINAVISDLHPNDFKEIWAEISAHKTKVGTIEKIAPPIQSAQAVIQVNSTSMGVIDMSSINDSLSDLMSIDGAMGCFIADYTSGMLLAKEGGGIDLDVAGAGNTEVIKAKMKTMNQLGLKDAIEDILITLGKQYHIIRPLATKQGLFLYLVLDKTKSNLAMARFKLSDVEKTLVV